MFEPEETPARSEKDENLEERRKIFAEKIAVFEKTTPKKSRKMQEGFVKKTPRVERSSSHHRKVYGAHGKEMRNMQEGLPLGHATARRKIGNSSLKVIDNLARQGKDLEVASPPHQQVRITNPKFNPFAAQDQAKPLEISSNVRKDMIGSRQEIEARPGIVTNQVYPTTGLGGVQAVGDSGSTGAGTWLQTSM